MRPSRVARSVRCGVARRPGRPLPRTPLRSCWRRFSSWLPLAWWALCCSSIIAGPSRPTAPDSLPRLRKPRLSSHRCRWRFTVCAPGPRRSVLPPGRSPRSRGPSAGTGSWPRWSSRGAGGAGGCGGRAPGEGAGGFALALRLAADGRALDSTGTRSRRPDGSLDLLVAVADAAPRVTAEDERDRLRARPWTPCRARCGAGAAPTSPLSTATPPLPRRSTAPWSSLVLERGRELGAGIIPQGRPRARAKAR